TNDRGSIRMDGGGGSAPIKIRSVDGLGYVTQNTATAVYPFIGGQKTISRTPGARLITVSADAEEGGKSFEGKLSSIAHDSGVLYITDGERKVYAESYVSNLSTTRAYGKDYERYIFQFTCDYPYFRDSVPTLSSLFERRRLLENTFTLPTVFSERVTDRVIMVSGDKEVYPKITVGGISLETESPLVIVNETTGAELNMLLPAGDYGLIVFDLWEGKITADGEDITRYLDDESYMSDFCLARGENKLKITAMDAALNTSSAVYFENEYFSALEIEDEII
ncbi:MAG: hypothetical protein ACI4SS_03535, partial [Clostridia bacterium]